MPAHGGQAQLSDLELTRAVAYMVSNGTAADTNKAYTPSHVRPGAQLVQERCQECHVAGTNGAPRIGEMNDWRARLTQGVAPLVRSAIKGHNSMPARGGLAGMSDVEMRSAVEFMLSKAGAGQPPPSEPCRIRPGPDALQEFATPNTVSRRDPAKMSRGGAGRTPAGWCG